MKSLFTMKVAEDKADKRFVLIRDTKAGAPARQLMDLIFSTYTDEDKSFVQEFQSKGFDARTWELSLHAFLSEADLEQMPTKGLVDFLVCDGSETVAIEAVTSQPTGGVSLGEATSSIAGLAPENINEGIAEFVHQFGKALWAKVQKRNAKGQAYWELDAIVGRPFVVAVEAFHGTSSLFHSFGYAGEYLFGRSAAVAMTNGKLEITPMILDVHEWNNKTIPSGVFDMDTYAHVSAVIFSNSSSTAQFGRIGLQENLGTGGVMIFRTGTCLRHDENADKPNLFGYEVGSAKAPTEYFSQAIHVFHNPNAAIPLPEGFFGNATEHFRLDSGHILTTVRQDFVPVSSVTSIIQIADIPKTNE
ncbi:hypothetical protein VUN82_11140 [Micrococcaceae bacterium Sec5.1]